MPGHNTINHSGYVESVSEQFATVKINSQSACAACHAKGACSAADQEEKVLTVSREGMQVSPGEQVMVTISRRTGLRAVAFGYIYPFLLIMLVLITMTALGSSELKAGIGSLLALPPYYLIIYLLKNRIGNSFTFKMQKI